MKKTKERGTCPHCERRCYVYPLVEDKKGVRRHCYAHSHIPSKAVTRPQPCPGAGEVCLEDRKSPTTKDAPCTPT